MSYDYCGAYAHQTRVTIDVPCDCCQRVVPNIRGNVFLGTADLICGECFAAWFDGAGAVAGQEGSSRVLIANEVRAKHSLPPLPLASRPPAVSTGDQAGT